MLPAAVTVLILLLLIGTVLHISTSRSDTLAVTRQTDLVSVAIRHSIKSIANDQEASTLWDDAVLQLRQRPLDYDWIDNNLGIWFNTYYQHDETYLIAPGGQVIYAMVGGRRVRTEAFGLVAAKADPLIAEMRKDLHSGTAAPRGSPGQTKGVVDFAMVSGHPAILSLKPVVPETDEIRQAPGQEYLHISVRFLDGSYLTALRSEYGIDGVRFSVQPTAPGAVGLRDRSGNRIGYIVWDPFEPGEQVAAQMLPALLAALALIAITLTILLLQQRRNRLRLAESGAAIEHLAYHDVLTGLPNRASFRNRLDAALNAPHNRDQIAVLLLDLDRFKLINDAFGHAAGDAVICAFAKKLIALVPLPNIVARLGGDEFAVILDGPTDVRELCENILAAVDEHLEFEGQRLHIGVSIGIAYAGHTGTHGEELLRKADIALYRAKADGRDCFRFFDQHMDERIKRRTVIERELRNAMRHDDELALFFQPIFSAQINSPVGFEALLRWHQKDRPAWTADQFIPVAEESGLILSLGEWAMRQACEASLKLGDAFVSVNLSPLQCRSLEFVGHLLKIVKESNADPRRLQIEITERALIEGGEEAIVAINSLRSAGLRLVLEDFGTGYSSLKHLRSMQFDKLKVDRSLLYQLGEDGQAADLVAAVFGLGKVVGMTMAAEGVESVEQRDMLIAAGCAEMQGHLFAPALPLEGAILLIEQRPATAAA